MFAHQLAAEIGCACSLARLDALSQVIWKAWAAGGLADDESQRLSELLEARRIGVRGVVQAVGIPVGRASIFTPRRHQRTPDKAASVLRRRTLAASGPLPPTLAAGFTTSELAVMKVIGDEVRDRGLCDRSIAEIAARAGCSRTTVQNATRTAAMMGLVTIQERRRQGQMNLPNVVRVVSREWSAWLTRGPRRAAPPPFKSADPTDRQGKKKGIRGEKGRAFSPSNDARQRSHPPDGLRQGAPTSS